MHSRLFTVSAIAFVMAAGSAVSLGAADLAVTRSGSRSTLGLNGVEIHSTAGTISRPRLIQVAGSSKILALWEERGDAGRTTQYYALSLDGRRFAQVQPTTYDIRLVYGTFDPRSGGEPVVSQELKASKANRVYLVQFVAPPIDEFRRDIAAMGGTVSRYLTDHTHVVTMDAGAAAKVAGLPYVRWVGAYHPAYRLSPEVRAGLAAPETVGARYSIECFQRGVAQQQAVADRIAAMGGIVEVTSPDQFRLEATLTRQQLLAVAHMNEVNYIDPWGGPGGTDMNVIRQLVGAVPTLSNINMTGQGVRGEVHDTEVLTSHQAFQSPPPLLHGGSAGSAGNLHGSACYGINFADWPANTTYNGLVTSCEQGIFLDYTLSTQFGGPTTRLTLNTEATNAAGLYRSVFQTSSVGSAQITNYSTVSAETDDYLFLVDYLSCQSQSNTGNMTSRPQAWAKNIVSVGGVDWQSTLARNDDAWSSASFGPAADGRVKPDLTNCYSQIPSTWGSGTTATTDFGGTSGATPITAGTFGLLMQMWHEGVWTGFGGGVSVFADRPRSTTAKALMVNTAFRYPLGQGGLTRARQGWGMSQLDNLYNLRAKTVIVNETDPLLHAQTATYNFTIPPGEPVVGFTMVYIDPAGNPAASQARINDLSLKVTDANGQVYWGNNGLATSNFSTAGGVANTVDTVENVFIQNPPSGNWTVEVIGTSIVQDARPQTPGVTDAAFALVATGVQAGPPPALYIQLPGGIPSLVPPGSPTDITVRVISAGQNVVPGSPTMHYRLTNSGSFTAQTLVPISGDDYRATLPSLLCENTPQFYFSAQGHLGATMTLPTTAPATFFTTLVGVTTTTTPVQIDFTGALPAGWTADGLWHLTSSCPPPGTACAGPQAAYYGQDTNCNFNTGAANTGTLTSPPISIPTVVAGGSVSLSFCSALQTEGNTTYDKAEVLVNGGVVMNAPEGADWATRTVDITQFAGQTVTLAFRFTATDGVLNDFRGWHVDDIRISATGTTCTNPTTCYANCDGVGGLTANDFSCFLNRYANGESYANCDGVGGLTANDFACFLNAYANGCS
jgi:serine protease AprX